MSTPYKTVTSAGPEAPWLTLVHGMTQDHRVFSSQVHAFREKYRILLIDLPGHGLATSVPGPYGHLEMMGHVRRALDHAAIGPTHFWATHTGTAVGLLLAIREPQRFRSLILEGAVVSGAVMPYISKTLTQASQTAKKNGITAAIRDIFYAADWYAVMRSHPDQCRAREHYDILADFAGAPWIEEHEAEPAYISDEDLRHLTVPTLVYNGQFDLDDFVQTAQKLQQLLPVVERTTIANAGGFPAWEYPQPVNQAVGEFLRQQQLHSPIGLTLS